MNRPGNEEFSMRSFGGENLCLKNGRQRQSSKVTAQAMKFFISSKVSLCSPSSRQFSFGNEHFLLFLQIRISRVRKGFPYFRVYPCKHRCTVLSCGIGWHRANHIVRTGKEGAALGGIALPFRWLVLFEDRFFCLQYRKSANTTLILLAWKKRAGVSCGARPGTKGLYIVAELSIKISNEWNIFDPFLSHRCIHRCIFVLNVINLLH